MKDKNPTHEDEENEVPDAPLTFRVNPRVLRLLGDQLIRDANLAVFELVKNAYDADATKCTVTLANPNDATSGSIAVEDDGVGRRR